MTWQNKKKICIIHLPENRRLNKKTLQNNVGNLYKNSIKRTNYAIRVGSSKKKIAMLGHFIDMIMVYIYTIGEKKQNKT